MNLTTVLRQLGMLSVFGGTLPFTQQVTDIRCSYVRYIECTLENCSSSSGGDGYVLVPQLLVAPPTAPRLKDGRIVNVRLCDEQGCQPSQYSAWNVGAFVELVGPAHDVIKIERDDLGRLGRKGAFSRVFTTGTIVRAYFGSCRVEN